jgi:hypothetical protein
MRRLDVTRRVGIVAQSFAKLPDGDLQHGVADEGPRPYGLQQLLLRDQLARVVNEVLQDPVPSASR